MLHALDTPHGIECIVVVVVVVMTLYELSISLKIDWTSNQMKHEFTPTGIGISTYDCVRISHLTTFDERVPTSYK